MTEHRDPYWPTTPWARIVVWALAGTLVVALAVLVDVNRTGRNVLNLIQPGRSGPSVEVITEDFPDAELPSGIGQDGQQFYAVARAPMHLDDVSAHLDRPRYRLQRPLLPWLAWMLHPTGGGPGLVWAMVAIGLLALVGGGIATGALIHRLGGDARFAAVFSLLPGAYVAVRISTADHLALALLAVTLSLLLHDRPVAATGAAVLAVLAKESMAVPLLGLLLWRRDRTILTIVAAPVLAAAILAAYLRVEVEAAERQIIEITWPFAGIVSAAGDWVDGEELWAFAFVMVSVALGIAAIARRGVRDPVGGPLLAQLGITVLLIHDAIGLDFNAARIMAPVLLLGIAALACPRPVTLAP